jgi:hypothetical protein
LQVVVVVGLRFRGIVGSYNFVQFCGRRCGAGEEAAFGFGFVERGQENGAQFEIIAPGVLDNAQPIIDVKGLNGELVEGILEAADAFGEGLEVVFEGAAELGLEEFPFQGAQAVDLRAELAIPDAEGGRRNLEEFGDFTQGGAAGAKLEEFVFEFGGVHNQCAELRSVAEVIRKFAEQKDGNPAAIDFNHASTVEFVCQVLNDPGQRLEDWIIDGLKVQVFEKPLLESKGGEPEELGDCGQRPAGTEKVTELRS